MTAAGGRIVIALPTYNGNRFLQQALESALSQTYHNIEVHVVDDCSTDDTVAVASSLTPRVLVHPHRVHAGIGANWNRCIELSKGAQYLLLMHQDDLISPTLVEHGVGLLEERQEIAFVLAPIEQIDSHGQVIDRRPAARRDFVRQGLAHFQTLMRGPMPMWGPVGGIARRSFYDCIGKFDETFPYALDLQMYFRMLLAADVGFLAKPVYQWRRHDQQTTARHNKAQRYEELIRAKLDGLKRAENSGRFESRTLVELRRYVSRACCQAGRRYALGDADYARRRLRQARNLCSSAVLHPDYLAAAVRMFWSRTFGPTAAGRARLQRKGI